MPAKRRGSRRSGGGSGGGGGGSGNDGDQGRLLEPGSSREEDEQRHPHAHTNDPATRTESLDKAEEEAAAAATNLRNTNGSNSGASAGAEGAVLFSDPLQAGSTTIQQHRKPEADQNHPGGGTSGEDHDRLVVHAAGGPSATSTPLPPGRTTSTATTTSQHHPPSGTTTNNTLEPVTPIAPGAAGGGGSGGGSSQNTLAAPNTASNTSNSHSRAGSQVSRQSAATSATSGGGSATNRSRSSARGRQAGVLFNAQGAPLQKVVYYQNRFITIPIDPADAAAVAAAQRRPGGLPLQQQQARSGPAGGERDGGGGGGGKPTGGTRTIQLNPGGTGGGDMDPNIAAMAGLPQPGAAQQPAAPPPPPKKEKKRRKMPKFLKKIAMCLQDNRMRTGNDETKEKIREMNENQNTTNMVLKKILNIIFVTTGITLFLAVVIVIIYTSIGNWWILASVPAPAGWDTGSPDASASTGFEGKPGTNPGETAPLEPRTPAPQGTPQPSVTETDFIVEPLGPEDEDHAAYPGGNVPVAGAGNDWDSVPIESIDDPLPPYMPVGVGEDYEGGYYPYNEEYGDYDVPIVVMKPKQTDKPEARTRRPQRSTAPPTTTPLPTTTPYFPIEFNGYDYDYMNIDHGGAGGDAYKHHRQALRQKLKEKQRFYKYRRRHRHYRQGRHRGNS